MSRDVDSHVSLVFDDESDLGQGSMFHLPLNSGPELRSLSCKMGIVLLSFPTIELEGK